MFQRPPFRAERSEASWTLRKVDLPDAGWYRSLFRRVGENSLWFSRLRMTDDELRDIINDSRCDIYVFEAQGKKEVWLSCSSTLRASVSSASLG